MKDDQLMTHLLNLKLSFFREYHQSLAKEAVDKNWAQLDFLPRQQNLWVVSGSGSLPNV